MNQFDYDPEEQRELLNPPIPRKLRKQTFRQNLPSYLLGASIAAVLLLVLCYFLFWR